MKRIFCYRGLGLLILLSIILAGCGGGGGGGSEPKINFSMPEIYQDSEGENYKIEAQKTVKFYCLTEMPAIDAKISADYVFSGTTGSNKMTFTLPNSLIDQDRYFIAVVILDDTFNSDLPAIQEMTPRNLVDAAKNGTILLGKSIIGENMQSYQLRDGITIGNFTFIGPSDNNPVSIIKFIIPEKYQGMDGKDHDIPAGKTVKFYSLSEIPSDDDEDEDEGVPIVSDHTFTGTTGEAEIECILPSELKGASRYFMAVVILGEDFDLQGKTKDNVIKAMASGQILLGQAKDTSGNHKSYILDYNVTIDGIEFAGLGGPITVKFTMPPTYLIEQEEGDPIQKEIPEGKTVKFYPLSEIPPDNVAINAEHIFTGTTGAEIECVLPPNLINKKRYFMAVVILKDNFELQGAKKADVISAVGEGTILFGQTKDPDDPNENMSYTLTNGVNVGGFVFIGADN